MSTGFSVFDGHNDALLVLEQVQAADAAFRDGTSACQVDLPRARRGGLAGGLFAMFTPTPGGPTRDELVFEADGSWALADVPPVAHEVAATSTDSLIARARRLADAADGKIEIVRDVARLDRCRAEERLAIVLHIEGAEAIDPDLEALERLHADGLRSVGLTWGRPNAFGHGVPFRFPARPDTGPGLSAAGVRLVRRCNEIGLLVDVAHLNEAGFWDVARTATAPFVSSHTAVHALCPSTRNLTDEQLRAVAAANGLVGVIFDTATVRADGRLDPDTPIATIVDHVRYLVELIGVAHVALGSDFDGALMPHDLGDAAALPGLIRALSSAGFTPDELERITWGNWRRVLAAAWRD
jgi:membrane dipeptidase